MSVRASLLALITVLSIVTPLVLGAWGCSPAPRSASYFQAHLTDAKAVAAACRVGATRGPECLNAESGIAAAARDARMASYHKSF